MMQWSALLNLSRLCDPVPSRDAETEERPAYYRDIERITFSDPFRRLANKTQVHPLYEHDHIHHRLIHSVETVNVGRSLGMGVGLKIRQRCPEDAPDPYIMSGVVQAACLAHDIGNPPFGHSGEAAIGEWFARHFDRKTYSLLAKLDEKDRGEFTEFEGNAQGFRLLSRLEMYRNRGGMRLSKAVLAAFSKYPVTAYDHKREFGVDAYCGAKKFGIFRSELEYFNDVANSTGLISKGANCWRRHPLVFLVEAADDICYSIMDIEDAHTSGELSYAEVERLLMGIFRSNQSQGDRSEGEQIAYYRAKAIGVAINACIEAFMNNYDDIMVGSFSGSLINSSVIHEQFKELVLISKNRIYKSHRKMELEVFGRNVIHRIMDGVVGVYQDLKDKKWNRDEMNSYHRRLVDMSKMDIRDVHDEYSALHSLTDYVSGMTDRYAVKMAHMLTGG
ncbi:dGTP triphosphohydrolase [Insolitispirillum peregrinum]|uniref:dGTPase n=1 Tax=Insolitispirillum peregrinum TaxID=80876 RepID=A0A1N7MIK9_9PROT|nr:dNTP triphosphohydrolase [Insolitispirillum peregrinum]SIS85923.1 dGTPase [Insolitispirillum peregrinum]